MTTPHPRHPIPKWIIPLLAEPVEESWKKLCRRGDIVESPAAWNGPRCETCGAVDYSCVEVQDTLRLPLRTRRIS